MLKRGTDEERRQREANKALQKEAKASEALAKQDQLDRTKYLATPVGRADQAYQTGAGFFQIDMSVSEMKRDLLGQTYTIPGTAEYQKGYGVKGTQKNSHADTLSAIEAMGWHLEHVGYAYVMTGQVSRDKLLSSGQEVGVMGDLVGIYLFRRNDAKRIDTSRDSGRPSLTTGLP